LAVDQDYFIPVRDASAPDPITTLPGAGSFLTRGVFSISSMAFRDDHLVFLQNTRFNNPGDYCDIPFYLFQIQFKYYKKESFVI
jgi:hypothetical protein